MTEYRTDILMRLVDDIARLSAQVLTLRQLGLEDDVLTELVVLEGQVDKLDEAGRARVLPLLDDLRSRVNR